MYIPVIPGIHPHPELPATTFEFVEYHCLRNLVRWAVRVIEDTYSSVKERETLSLGGGGAEADEAGGQHGEGEEEVADDGTDFRDFHGLWGLFFALWTAFCYPQENLT